MFSLVWHRLDHLFVVSLFSWFSIRSVGYFFFKKPNFPSLSIWNNRAPSGSSFCATSPPQLSRFSYLWKCELNHFYNTQTHTSQVGKLLVRVRGERKKVIDCSRISSRKRREVLTRKPFHVYTSEHRKWIADRPHYNTHTHSRPDSGLGRWLQ